MLRVYLSTSLAGVVLVSSAQTSFAQTSLGLAAVEGAGAVRQEVGKRFTYVCPASDGAGGSVYGTDTYTESSPICAAAIHAGVLKPRQDGIVSIDIGKGAQSFIGSARNGVTSQSYGSWGFSYTFARDAAPGTISWTTTWSKVPASFMAPITVACPAGGKTDAPIWGTDVYTVDSAICVAAVHAGAITAQKGGVVVVKRAATPASYPGTVRQGVTSKKWGSARDAFTVAAAAAPSIRTTSAATCALADAFAQMFATMKANVTSQYAAIDATAQATPGFDARALTVQRDALLTRIDEIAKNNDRDANAACAPPLTTQSTTSGSNPGQQTGSGTVVTGTETARETVGRGVIIADDPGLSSAIAPSPPGPPPADFRVNGFPGVAELRWTMAQSISEVTNVDPFSGTQAEQQRRAQSRYHLFRSNGANWTELPLDRDGRITEAFDQVPDPAIGYRYRLEARYPDGTVGEAIVSWQSPPPTNPAHFTARLTGPNVVTLEWDLAMGAVEYRIDGTGLPNTGNSVTQNTTTVTPANGSGTWSIVAIYRGGIADYANRPTASVAPATVPPHAPAWLSMRNGAGNAAETARHYTQLCNARYQPFLEQDLGRFCASLAGVLMSWGVPEPDAMGGPGNPPGILNSAPGPGTVGYTNLTELGSHRNSYCHVGSAVPGGGGIVCHSETSSTLSLIVMTPAGARFAAYDRLPPPAPNSDEAYYYGGRWWGHYFGLAPTTTLDSEGPKFVPHACLSCHGGQYDPTTGLVTGASLLPIDPSLVVLDSDPAAQEKIRAINALIRRSYSSPAVAAYIVGLYGGMSGNQYRVDMPGTVAIPNYVPQGWAQQSTLYLDFVKKDCAMCHLAVPTNLNFLTAGNLLASKPLVQAAVCTAHSMPHAEVPYRRFWTSRAGAVSGPGWFAAALGITGC
jgi:hypothetical protein